MSEPPACLQQESNQLSLARTPPWLWDFPSGSVVKNWPAKAGDVGSIPGLGRSPREENGKLFQYSCLENPTDRGVWQSHRSQKRLKNSNNNNSLAINSHFFPPYSELSLTFPPPPTPQPLRYCKIPLVVSTATATAPLSLPNSALNKCFLNKREEGVLSNLSRSGEGRTAVPAGTRGREQRVKSQLALSLCRLQSPAGATLWLHPERKPGHQGAPSKQPRGSGGGGAREDQHR